MLKFGGLGGVEAGACEHQLASAEPPALALGAPAGTGFLLIPPWSSLRDHPQHVAE